VSFASLNALLDAQTRSSGDLWITLATVTHPTFSPLRIASPRWEPLISRGITFGAGRFDAIYPLDQFDDSVRASIVYEGTSGEILAALQGLRPRPLITLEIVLESDPNTVLFTAPELEISSLTQEGLSSTTLELEFPQTSILPFPGINMDRVRVPGMFTDL